MREREMRILYIANNSGAPRSLALAPARARLCLGLCVHENCLRRRPRASSSAGLHLASRPAALTLSQQRPSPSLPLPLLPRPSARSCRHLQHFAKVAAAAHARGLRQPPPPNPAYRAALPLPRHAQHHRRPRSALPPPPKILPTYRLAASPPLLPRTLTCTCLPLLPPPSSSSHPTFCKE